MKIKRMSIFILGICILLTACQPPQMADVEVPPQMVEVDEPPNEELPDEPEEDSYEEVNIGEMLIHWDDGTIQYGSRNEGDFLVLYEISGNGAEMTQIATFRSFYTPYGLLPRIMSFDILDSWIIFTLGGFLESDHRLANVFFRMKRGGSELSEIFVYWNDGIIQYGSRIGDDDSRVLYEIRGQGAEMTQVAIFPPFDVERGLAPSIVTLDIIDDWIILTVGGFSGSEQHFVGDFLRMRRDGSGRESFQFGSEFSANPWFIVINDWIYYNDWGDIQSAGGYGWLRTRVDETEKELLDRAIASIAFFGDDGYIYGTHRAEEMGGWRDPVNLMRWQPESDIDEAITLFVGGTLPKCDASDWIGFRDIVVGDDYVTFTAFVWGYRQGDGWRGGLIYTAYYRVDKDGSNLTLLGEEYH